MRATAFSGQVATLILALAPFSVAAEKADRQQTLRMSSKQFVQEGPQDANTRVLEGDVLITQGSMRITAEKAIVKETAAGVTAELFGSSTSQITFRQKREGTSDFIDASADRAEYDDKSGTLKLYSRVRFKSGNDVADSEFMQYNSTTEKMELRNQIPGAKPKTGADDGRVVFEVQPRAADGKPVPAKKN